MNKRLLLRLAGAIGTVVCIVIYMQAPSFPTLDKLTIFATCVFLALGQAWPMLQRLLPFVALLLVYDSFRGVIPYLNKNVNYTWMVDVDKFMVGGALPTAALQRWLWNGQVQWYDFVLYLTYMLHFVLPFVLALIIWKRREKFYWRYVTAYVSVSFAGFFTFLAFPAAPPWMASEKGIIEPIHRISSDVWFALGVHDFPSIYNKITPNTVAAVPSLHAAYATLFALFIFKVFPKSKWKYLSIIYPAFIYFGTVYMGEHYIIDELLGGLYALGAFLAAPYILRFVIRWGSPVAQKTRAIWAKMKNAVLH